ncbi:MAG TPA: hypothetical protein VNN73_12020 [Blastocatellia bacterium]|nr:hypothetical protein [Blastocatellia bacterium]
MSASQELLRLDNLNALNPIAASDAIHNVHAFDNLAKDGVAAVEISL